MTAAATPARSDGLTAPQLEPVFTLYVELDPPITVGRTAHGTRRIIPITGGTFTGPAASGVILPGGADWNLVRDDGVTHLWARYTIRTDDGATIMITNEGWGTQDDETMARIFSGAGAETTDWYCRTNPRFEAGEPRYAWLNHTVFVGDLRPPTRGDQVVIDVYRVT